MNQGSEQFDLIIVGAGPAGISACEAAQAEGLNYLCLERGLIGNTIYHYPIGGTVFSTVNELELKPETLKPAREKPTREELLSYYVRYCLNQNFRIRTGEAVEAIERNEAQDCFYVQTEKAFYVAKRVLVCVGAMAYPRRLHVLGEELPHVHHLFYEAYPYVKRPTLVVGGGNSAGEAALFLAEEGSLVSLATLRKDWENRDPKMGCIKHWVREPLERAIENGKLNLILFDHVEEITNRNVRMIKDDGEELILRADAVFVLIGADPDLSLLRGAGVDIVRVGTLDRPVYHEESFETNVSGLFVAGHFTHARHIVEAIATPRRIMPHIVASLKPELTLAD